MLLLYHDIGCVINEHKAWSHNIAILECIFRSVVETNIPDTETTFD